LKLAALLHDVAKPETRAEVGGRVRFIGTTRWRAPRRRHRPAPAPLATRRAVIERLVAEHLRPCIWRRPGSSRGARGFVFRALGDEGATCCSWPGRRGGLDGGSPLAVWAAAGVKWRD